MTESQPFDSTHIKTNGDIRRLTWYQELAINHAAHPEWSAAQHIAALNKGIYDMVTVAAVYGTTPEAMIAEALEGIAP